MLKIIFRGKKGSSFVPSMIIIGLISLFSIGALSLFGQKSSDIFDKTQNLIEVSMRENEPPVIETQLLDPADRNLPYSYTLSANDPEDDPLSWSWSGNTPSGISLSTNGTLSGITPTEGDYDVQISVNDGKNQTSINTTLRVLGCTEGAVGSVCDDGTIYIGTSGQRTYLVPTRRPAMLLSEAKTYCANQGSILPTGGQGSLIYQTANITGINLSPSSQSFWTSTQRNSSVVIRYSSIQGGIYEYIFRNREYPFYCVKY